MSTPSQREFLTAFEAAEQRHLQLSSISRRTSLSNFLRAFSKSLQRLSSISKAFLYEGTVLPNSNSSREEFI